MLSLEKLTAIQQQELAALANDPLVSVTCGVDYPCTIETVQEWMDESSGDPPQRATFVIRLDGEMAGACSLKHIDYEKGTAEVSYWVGRTFWGRGVAKRAIKALIEFAFDQLQLQQLEAFCLRDNNQPSLSVLKGHGFELDTSRADYPTRLRWQDSFPDDVWQWHILSKAKWQMPSSTS